MGLWWEVHEKHEEALLNHTQFETDESMEQFIHIENSPPKKKKKPTTTTKKVKKGNLALESLYFLQRPAVNKQRRIYEISNTNQLGMFKFNFNKLKT